MNNRFPVPEKDEVGAINQGIYDMMTKAVGFMPNLYAELAYSSHALKTYMTAQNSPSSLTAKEKEAVNLVVSQVNTCAYCLAAHSELARRAGFTDDQIIQIRKGKVNFDPKLDALVAFTKSLMENKGHVQNALVNNFFTAGYSNENMMDLLVLAGIRLIANYLYALTNVDIDWPHASEI